MSVRDRSKVIRQGGFRWQGVESRAYKDPAGDGFRGVTRQEILGGAADEAALSFHTRYFEIEAGGWSSLERHGHPHAVVVLRGRGAVVLPDGRHDLEPFDCVYVAPDDAHQFRAAGDGPLGFLCVVDRHRDRPRPVAAGDESEP